MVDSHGAQPPLEVAITVVVACVEASRSIEKCLASIDQACAGLRAQVVVVDASRDRTQSIVRNRWPAVELLRFPPGTVVPQLWTAGLRVARGRAVAFTIGHVCVPPTWARALLRGLEDAAGVGGPLVLDDHARVRDWAIFYLRYSAMLPSQLPDGLMAGDVAGDNAAYLRIALERQAPALADGFWEVEFHRQLRADGDRLRAASQATVAFTGSPFWCMARHRYAHGRHFGRSRVAHGTSAMRVVGAAPLVPFVLAWRASRRALPKREHQRRFLLCLPLLLVLAAAWAAGEAHGALTHRPVRVPVPA